MKPYTYLIKCIPINKFYYGVRYAKDCDPSELWITYFTSSKEVKNLLEIYGKEAFQFEIRKTFEDRDKARYFEHKVLKRIKAKSREDFINKTDNISFDFESCSKGSKGKGGELHNRYGSINPHLSELNKAKVGSKNPFYGKTHTEEFLERKRLQRQNEIWITDGFQNKFILKGSEIPSGWVKGKTQKRVNKIWINDGDIEKYHIRSIEIPNGWVQGRLNRKGY